MYVLRPENWSAVLKGDGKIKKLRSMTERSRNSGSVLKIPLKKILGSAVENRVGRVSGNTGIFLFGLKILRSVLR